MAPYRSGRTDHWIKVKNPAAEPRRFDTMPSQPSG